MELSQDRKDEGGRTPSGGGDDEGTRQPYNCTFCKRGFPTAQALGGHMNVHRKDRGRATPAIRSTGYGTILAFTGYGQTHPASGSEASTEAGGSWLHAERAQQELRLFGRDDCAGRGKDQGCARDPREYYSKDGDGDHDEGEEELDLELRLGGSFRFMN